MNFATLTGRGLYRNPAQGKMMGVCAGLAEYFNLPANLIRFMVVLSFFAGLFFLTPLAYFALGFFLQKKPADAGEAVAEDIDQVLTRADEQLRQGEHRLRKIERYVTSETFSTHNRFRQL